MDLQKEREAFDQYFKEKYPELYKDVFDKDGDDRAIIGYSFAWSAWQAVKAKAVPEVVTIGNELQSWVAVHSFAAKDGNDIVCAVDANALAEEIEKLTGANA